MNQEDDFDRDEDIEVQNKISRKKILIFIIPVLVVIGLAVGMFYVFNRGYDSSATNYSVVKNVVDENGSAVQQVTVFYDLPEINARLKDERNINQSVKMKISLELARVEDIPTVEKMLPRINDAVIAHTIELTPAEISDASGLYWLKEELLYRINLLISPVKATNLNFKNFEIQSPDNS